jgi:hypothetical protein
MKKVMCAALVAAFALSAGSVRAEELWNPHLRGLDEGLAAGALPPEGFYMINDSYFGQWKDYNGSGNGMPHKLDVFVDAPILLWSTGLKFLGADYAVAVAQPFDYTSTFANSVPSAGNGHIGSFNTILVPGMLSWALPYDFHVKTSLAVALDDASSSSGKFAPPNDGAGAGNGFTTFEPGVGVSWLHDGWNLSADMQYDYNLIDSATHYLSGDQIAIDYTATKTFDKWTAGLGAYQENQLERDRLHGVGVADSSRQTYGIGPIAGYDFGPVNVQAIYNFNLLTQNDNGGNFFNLRFIVPLH